MRRMATAPARPDLGPAAAPTHRPTIVLGLAAALAWVISALPAYRAIGWFPPPRALAILAAGAPLVLAAGIALGRVATGAARSAAGIVLVIGALVLPWVLATSVPGVAHPQEFPLPGGPAVALTAAPEGNAELWVMRGDAGHVTRLTSTAAQELGADLSPDGSRVVFATDAAGTWDLSVMTLGDDGGPGPVARLTTREDADEVAADWSPDGTRIAFAVDLGERGEIWLVDADGSNARRIVSEQAGATAPSWSPDGSRIAYSAGSVDDPFDADIWIADADGSDAQDVIDAGGDDRSPFWSPDGSTLLFTGDATGDADAWTCSLPCDEPRNVTSRPDAADSAAGWTPDGHAIVASDRLHYGGTFVYFVDDRGRMQLSLII